MRFLIRIRLGARSVLAGHVKLMSVTLRGVLSTLFVSLKVKIRQGGLQILNHAVGGFNECNILFSTFVVTRLCISDAVTRALVFSYMNNTRSFIIFFVRPVGHVKAGRSEPNVSSRVIGCEIPGFW